MKNSFSLMCAAVFLAFTSCNNNKTSNANADSVSTTATTVTTITEVIPGKYVDLNTGKTVYIVKDPETGFAMDSIAKIPVEFYVNTSTKDTIYETGAVVNNSLIKTNGKWSLSDDAKVKIDGDKMKIKDGDSKIKVKGDKIKTKDDDTKTKTK